MKDVVVTEIGELGQVQDGLPRLVGVHIVVVHLHHSLLDEVHFFQVGFVGYHDSVLLVNSAVHLDNKFVSETSLALLEEVAEGLFELFESSCVLNQVSLHLGGNLVVEIEFFNDEVEIVLEGLFYVVTDIVV